MLRLAPAPWPSGVSVKNLRTNGATAPKHANVTLALWGWVIAKDMSDDGADVRRVLAGDVDAYAALVDRYYDRCARYAVRMLGNRDDAEDALQATFLRAYRALNRYQDRDRFSAWLYRILVNQCRSVAARRAHR